MTVPSFYEIRIENTNACGYKCIMCPREKQTRKIGYMSFDDFALILDQIGPFEGRVHLHGFGEPLLDRSLVKKIGHLKQKMPRSEAMIFSTLGVSLQDDHFTALADSGLDQLIVSFYGFSKESYIQIHQVDRFEQVKANLETLSRAIKKNNSSLKVHLKIPSQPDFPHADASFYQWIAGLGFEIGLWTAVHNYGNGRDFNPPGDRLCPVVQGNRKYILNVTWDLHVIPCCFDFNATIRFGNLRQQSLSEIFSSAEYLKFLVAHKTNDLSNYPACQTCEKHDVVC